MGSLGDMGVELNENEDHCRKCYRCEGLGYSIDAQGPGLWKKDTVLWCGLESLCVTV